ncbi:MAG: ParA family partition ATPase [Blastocatellia bacterium]
MSALIVVVANQKGGSGKTTVSMQLAGTIAQRGLRVLVADTDPQATATRWAASAPDDAPFPAAVIGLSAAEGKVHRELRRHVDNYDLIVVDCPPAVDSTIPQSALVVGNLALVPVIPSPADLWATVGIRRVIDNIRAGANETLNSRLLLNQCDPHRTLAREAVEILPEFGIELASSRLGHREVYRQSVALGATVHVLGSRAAQAIAEVEALADEVLEILGVSATAARGGRANG